MSMHAPFGGGCSASREGAHRILMICSRVCADPPQKFLINKAPEMDTLLRRVKKEFVKTFGPMLPTLQYVAQACSTVGDALLLGT